MSGELHAKCACQNCGRHIEFPMDAAGLTVDCPHCQKPTQLSFEAPPADSSRPGAVEIINAFHGGITPTRISFLYQIGLVLVAITMLILPLIYLALVGALAWAIIYFAVHCRFLVMSMPGGPRLYLVTMFVYALPLFIGCLLLFFMIKPLFARQRKRARPLALNPGVEPTLFAFIARICETVGAPMPARISLNCDLNASASFRRGLLSLSGNDLELTLGLPLVAGLNMSELAGVIAHEFGHFSQGFGMRVTYLIVQVNRWFARVVYERDAWDQWLAAWVMETNDWRSMIIAAIAHFAVWSSRLLLKLLMLFGHGVCCFLLRHMEYDADSYQIKLAGSSTFERTALRVNVLSEANTNSLRAMQAAWKVKRMLPDNFPAFLLLQESKITSARRQYIEDSTGLSRTGIFSTHPSFGDRIRRARQAAAPGVFQLDRSAMLLFSNFEAVSKQVTHLHYTDDVGLQFEESALQPVHPPAPAFV